jgi:hypothetical protein
MRWVPVVEQFPVTSNFIYLAGGTIIDFSNSLCHPRKTTLVTIPMHLATIPVLRKPCRRTTLASRIFFAASDGNSELRLDIFADMTKIVYRMHRFPDSP